MLAAVLLAVIAVWPLRGLLDAVPLVRLLGTSILFMAPGALLWRWFLSERFPGVAGVPAAFTIGAGVFGILGVPVLILHRGLEEYLLLSGALLAGVLIPTALHTLFLREPRPAAEEDPARGASSGWLWVPFMALIGALVVAAGTGAPVDDDSWNYLAWVREFLNTENLALYDPYFGDRLPALHRVKINGWLLEQAALSRLSGIDPIRLEFEYLRPALVVVAVLAFHTLARVLLSRQAALMAGCVYALFMLVHLGVSPRTFGGEFIGRITQDKFVAWYIFLPVALAAAVAFIESRKVRYLGFFAFLCWAVVSVHPIGIALIGVSMAGFGLVYLAFRLRDRRAWAAMLGLGGVLLSVLLLPVAAAVAVGKPLAATLRSADIGGTSPEVLANMVFVRPRWDAVYEFDNGLYTMHPTLILDRFILAAYVLGVPFLLRRALRGRTLAAQMLLGMMLFVAFLVYFPPVSTFLGEHVVLAGQLRRLAWPIPLASLLTLGWLAHEAVRYAGDRLIGRGLSSRRAAALFPLALVVLLMLFSVPRVTFRVLDLREMRSEVSSEKVSRFDPVFTGMSREIDEPAVVLAPDHENLVIPAYSSDLDVVSMRGEIVISRLSRLEKAAGEEIPVPRRAWDVHEFFYGDDISLRRYADILRRQRVDYVLVPGSEEMPYLPGLVRQRAPGENYALYSVDPRYIPASSGEGRLPAPGKTAR